MQKAISILKTALFAAIGLAILYLIFKDRDWNEIVESLKYDFNYWWIGFSLLLGIGSHACRALRWQMLIGVEEKKPGFVNTLGAVLTGYLANLILPRMGEVSKCGVISKYENISFARVAGTVVIERLADLIGMLALLVMTLAFEYKLVSTLLSRNVELPSFAELMTSPGFWLVVALLIIAIYLTYRISKKLFRTKFAILWSKFSSGISSYKKLNNKPLFIILSAAIWLFYFLMLYVCFFAMDETKMLGPTAGLTVLITGSLGMLAPIQGGMGPWHFMVIQTLILYGISEEGAGNFALVVHSSQNLMVIVLGLASFVILPVYNRIAKRK
jgi:uncharacterized protein (TIRG00374 family)